MLAILIIGILLLIVALLLVLFPFRMILEIVKGNKAALFAGI